MRPQVRSSIGFTIHMKSPGPVYLLSRVLGTRRSAEKGPALNRQGGSEFRTGRYLLRSIVCYFLDLGSE